MISIDRAVIVEGKYDKIKLSSILDATIIETDGFGIFSNKEKQKLIKRIAIEKGIIILTDSDAAGFKIRSFLSGFIPNEYILHAYIPDILGKESRKNSSSKEGKLGVEGIPLEKLLIALNKAGIACKKSLKSKQRKITKADLYEDGLFGKENSKQKRLLLIKHLDYPERLSTNSMIKVLNVFLSFEDYKKALEHIENSYN